jgi:hypothetical protein
VRRSGWLKRFTGLVRKTRLRAKGGSRFPKRRCQPYLDWLWDQPCQVSGLRDVEPAHIKTRGSGGYDLYNALSLSWLLHREQEGRTKEFEQKYRVNLKELARKQTEEFLELYPQYRLA